MSNSAKFELSAPSDTFFRRETREDPTRARAGANISVDAKNINTNEVILIGIPSFRRPKSLIRTLASVAQLKTNLQLKVLVADNDAQRQEAVTVVKQLQSSGYRWPIESIVVSHQGISQVRNAIVKHGFHQRHDDYQEASAIAMIDDDQCVSSNWLSELVAIQEQTQADIVGCLVKPEYQTACPGWAKGLYVYENPPKPDGHCDVVDGTGGILIMRRVTDLVKGRYFDHDYSLTGGGDSEFFLRVKNRGATFAYARNAVAFESIHPSQLTRRWALKRAFRIGSGHMRIMRRHCQSQSELAKEYLKAISAVVIAPLIMLRHFFNPRKFSNGGLLLARNLGKLTSLFQFHVKEYKTPIKK